MALTDYAGSRIVSGFLIVNDGFVKNSYFTTKATKSTKRRKNIIFFKIRVLRDLRGFIQLLVR